MFVLDTDLIVVLQRQSQPECNRLLRKMGMHLPKTIYYSIVSFHEQALGANQYITRAKSPAKVVRGYGMLDTVLNTYRSAPVLPFDANAAAEFDSARAKKVRIGTMDLRIAAIALSRGMTVVTRNLRDFGKVPGLNIEDWTA
jgi:tRNA(fMet)-specific endonuclease VapC